MKFLIGSSYFEGGKGGSEFRRSLAHLWYFNTNRVGADKIIVISEAGSRPPTYAGVEYIHLNGDLGHCDDLIKGKKQNHFSGWSASMMASAMLAYVNECDFIYKEEDCLAFGPWVDAMYNDLGSGDIVFGKGHKSQPWMPCSQSLFLVRHSFIPELVRMYIAEGSEKDVNNLGENKFVRIEKKLGGARAKRLSFGFDRERPIRWDDKVFYVQQLTQDELKIAKTKNLI